MPSFEPYLFSTISRIFREKHHYKRFIAQESELQLNWKVLFVEDGNLVGRCGLYCGACTIYRAYKDGGEFRVRVARFFKCPEEKIKCQGCQALTPDSWGNDCQIVQCGRSEGYEFCYECSDYGTRSCEKFEELAKRYTEDKVDVRANLEKIKQGKTEEWLKESESRFRCPHCKKPLPEGSTKCYHCKQEFSMV
jgi:hypothetical protein